MSKSSTSVERARLFSMCAVPAAPSGGWFVKFNLNWALGRANCQPKWNANRFELLLKWACASIFGVIDCMPFMYTGVNATCAI